jgi:Ohr subfamily peroxiredoxin
MKLLYETSVTATNGRRGRIKSDDGVLDMPLSMPKSMGGSGEAHTNPEQLFAAGYAACFGGALKVVAGKHNVDIGDFNVTGNVSIGRTEEGDLELAVILDSYLPGIDVETGEMLVNEAHEICPYSRATRDNIDVTLNLLLDEEEE